MAALAEWIGANAVTTLCIASVALWIVIGVVWRLLERAWDPLWRLASRTWTALARSAFAERLRHVPWVKNSLANSLTVGRYVGLHALASLTVAIVGFVVFVEIADEITEHGTLAQFDAQLARALSTHVDLPTLETFALVTHLGDPAVTIGLAVLVALYLLVRRWWVHAVVWVLATGVGAILTKLLKHHFERTRPIHDHALTAAEGWSFPSGHASGAVLVYGMLGYLLIRHVPRPWHIPIALITVTVVTFVGFSRVILQVHYLSDVIAGFAIAAGWAALCASALEVVRRQAR